MGAHVLEELTASIFTWRQHIPPECNYIFARLQMILISLRWGLEICRRQGQGVYFFFSGHDCVVVKSAF